MKEYNNIINEISEEFSINKSFLEKDLYATKILYLLHNIKDNKFNIFFSGGTSLSKAYNIIKRFSEDLDFRVQEKTQTDRNDRRNFINNIVDIIDKQKIFKVNNIKKENQSHLITLTIAYPSCTNENEYLRPHIKIELLFDNQLLKPKKQKINSIIDTLLKNKNNSFNFLCINPIEILAEKCSALIWRTLYSAKFDTTILRHLYDISELKDLIIKNKKKFMLLLNTIYINDIEKNKKIHLKSIDQSIKEFYDKVSSKTYFSKEYQNFIQNMCYEIDSKNDSLNKSLKIFMDIFK